jgi:hypothetical protein
MIQEQLAKMRLIRGAASAVAFVAAVTVAAILVRFGTANTLGLALASTLVVAGALGLLRVPAAFSARFTQPGDWVQHGADFAVAAIGVWAVVSLFPASHDFLCEPLVPWNISIALFGAFAMNWLGRAIALRAPAEQVSLSIFLAFFWIAPFYGFFHAPWFLAQTIASPCINRPLDQSLIVTAGMVIAAEGGRRLANWLLEPRP